MLTATAIQSLAVTFAPDVIRKVAESEEFMEFMQEHIMDAIESEVGDISLDDRVELGMAIIDRLRFEAY